LGNMNELLSLVRELRGYIAQEHPELEYSEPVRAKAVAPPAPPLPAPARPKAVAKVAAAPPPPTAAPAKKEAPKAPLEPVMQALNRPFSKAIRAPLLDVVEKFDKLGIKRVDAPKEKEQAATFELTFVSFFAPGSHEEQFIKKVVASVNERLLATRLYVMPGLDAAAFLYTLAASKKSKAVILAHAQEDGTKRASFLAFFGDELHAASSQKAKLICHHTLFDVPLYDLILTTAQMEDTATKRALWADLQQLV